MAAPPPGWGRQDNVECCVMQLRNRPNLPGLPECALTHPKLPEAAAARTCPKVLEIAPRNSGQFRSCISG
eukprot:4155777-Alexandrium_andersonii.AAC.1